MSVTLLLGSRLGDILGRRRVLLTGDRRVRGRLGAVRAGADAGRLIAARALQGAIAAIMVPQGFGLVRELFGDEGQQKAFAIVGPVMGLGAVAGPLVGGGADRPQPVRLGLAGDLPRQRAGRRVAIVAGLRFLPRTPPSTPNAPPDVTQRRASMVGGFGLVYPLIEGRAHGWPVWSFALIAAGVRRVRGVRLAAAAARAPAAVRRWSIRRSCAGGRTSPGWRSSSASSARWAGC